MRCQINSKGTPMIYFSKNENSGFAYVASKKGSVKAKKDN